MTRSSRSTRNSSPPSPVALRESPRAAATSSSDDQLTMMLQQIGQSIQDLAAQPKRRRQRPDDADDDDDDDDGRRRRQRRRRRRLRRLRGSPARPTSRSARAAAAAAAVAAAARAGSPSNPIKRVISKPAPKGAVSIFGDFTIGDHRSSTRRARDACVCRQLPRHARCTTRSGMYDLDAINADQLVTRTDLVLRGNLDDVPRSRVHSRLEETTALLLAMRSRAAPWRPAANPRKSHGVRAQVRRSPVLSCCAQSPPSRGFALRQFVYSRRRAIRAKRGKCRVIARNRQMARPLL